MIPHCDQSGEPDFASWSKQRLIVLPVECLIEFESIFETTKVVYKIVVQAEYFDEKLKNKKHIL